MQTDNQAPGPQAMPPVIAYVLTHRLPCAALMLGMLTLVVWLFILTQSIPLLGQLLIMFGLVIHMLVPGLLALVTYGGGVLFAAQVAALASAAVVVLADFSLKPGLVVLVMYGLIPIVGAAVMMRENGMRKSAEVTALMMAGATLLSLTVEAMAQGVNLQGLVDNMVSPQFEVIRGQIPLADAEATQMLELLRQKMIATLPGLMMLGLWFTWWGNIVLARFQAGRYNFYEGDKAGLLDLRLGKATVAVFVVVLLLMNFSSGSVQYVAANAAFLVGGMLSAQGIAVAHSWLKAKQMMFSIVVMYLLLIVWPDMIVPFVVVGLTDIWFDYRRKIPAAGG